MKLIERKCPNCGASLKIKEGSKEVHCEYCKQVFDIDNDELQEAVNDFVKSTLESMNRANKITAIVCPIIFIIAFLIIVSVMISMFFF